MDTILSERCLEWESTADIALDPALPIILRLDGRCFSRWTHCCEQPFDPRMHDAMVDTARVLVREIGASYAFTQSDEITLVCHGEGTQNYFGWRVQKVVSSLAVACSDAFNAAVTLRSITPTSRARFDCRVFNVPDRAAAVDVVAWRESDGRRNSISGFGRYHSGHAAMLNVGTVETRRRLHECGTPWGALTDAQRFGTAVARRTVLRPFTTDEIIDLPPKHAARTNPALVVERHDYLAVPTVMRLANAEGVVFDGAEPIPR